MSEQETKREKKPIELELVDFRGDHRVILTFCELLEGDVLDVGLEITGEATRLKTKLDAECTITALVISDKINDNVCKKLIQHGADQVIAVENPVLKEYSTRPYASAVIQIINKYKPEICLFGATTFGRDLAPRVAAHLEVGLSADCTQFDIGPYENRPRRQKFERVAHFIRPSYAEAKLATIIGPWTFPQCATARPGAMQMIDPVSDKTGKIIREQVTIDPIDTQVQILEVHRGSEKGQGETVDLKSAQIIVAGGYGIGKDGFKLLRELVKAMNENGQKAELGASRKAVDSGFISYAHQVGQTGKSVYPKLYIAIGISGAIQHLAGMKHSKKVLAINRDSNAPIFSHADYGIVGNFEDIVPELIAKVKSGYKFII